MSVRLSSSMLFKTIEINGQSLTEIISCLKAKQYSPLTNEGFSIDEVSDKTVYANYIYESPTLISTFDENILGYKKEKTVIKILISFSIDISHNVLTIFTSSQKSHRLITELGKVFNFKLSISDVKLSPKTLILKLKENNINFDFKSIKVDDFNFENKYIGSYLIKIFEQSSANELISRYSDKISFFTANIELHNEHYAIGFFNNGKIRIYNKLEDNYEFVEQLKNIIFKGD